MEPGGSSGPEHNEEKSEITHWCTAGGFTAPVSHHVWSVQVWRHAECNRAAIQAHTAHLTPLSSSAPAGAVHSPNPSCHQEVIKASTSLLRLVILLPPTEIPAFLNMLPLFGVILLSISISDTGIWGVSLRLAVEVVGEEMWRSSQCHLIGSWRRMSGGRAIVGRSFCGELAVYEFSFLLM